MATREDGEISDSDSEGQFTSKSDKETKYPPRLRHDTDESSTDEGPSDLDDDQQTPAKQPQQSIDGPEAKKRKLHVWSNVLMEQQLTKDLCQSTHVDQDNQSKKISRGVESYTNRHQISESAVSEDVKSDVVPQGDDEDELFDLRNDGETRNVKVRLGKRKYNGCNSLIYEEIPKEIEEIDTSYDDRTIAKFIALGLREPKIELLHRVTRIFGKDKAIELYKTTVNVEEAGGLLTKTGERRTPGGVYIFLLKNHKDMTKEIERDIFAIERELASRVAKERKRAKRIEKYGSRGLTGDSTTNRAGPTELQAKRDTFLPPMNSTNNITTDNTTNRTAQHGEHGDCNEPKNGTDNLEDFELMEEPDIEIGVV